MGDQDDGFPDQMLTVYKENSKESELAVSKAVHKAFKKSKEKIGRQLRFKV